MLYTLHSLQASSASSALLRLLFQFYVAVELAYASTWALFNLLAYTEWWIGLVLLPGFVISILLRMIVSSSSTF